MNNQGTRKHPKGLYVLFFTEMWERFSYYGMRAIFSLYMLKALVFDKVLTSTIYGDYIGLVYLTPLIGGYIADRYWGNRKSIIVGGLLMVFGQLLLFTSAIFYHQIAANNGISLGHICFFGGLGFMIFGNGFFKPNISTMVGHLYPEGDKRLDSAMTIFYMGINIGALAAPIIAGGLGDTGNPADFKWGFLAAAIGMMIGLVVFISLKNKYIVTTEGKAIGIKPNKEKIQTDNPSNNYKKTIWASLSAAVLFCTFYFLLDLDLVGSFMYSVSIIVPITIITDKSLSRIERSRIFVIYVIAVFVIFFWAAYEQAGASLTFFADEQTNRYIDFLNWNMPASWFQVFAPAYIVIFAPLFAMMWSKLGKLNLEPASPYKQSIGLFLLAMGYLLISFGVKGVAADEKVSMFWLIGLYWLHTMGELSLSPIGLSMVVKLSPLKFSSLLMGVWFMAIATADKFAGILSTFYPDPNADHFPHILGFEINDLHSFFLIFVFMAGAASIILFILSRKLVKLMEGVR